MVKIATWNVNSLRTRLPHVLDWLAAEQPDILALQETKVEDAKFPLAEIEAAGYRAAYAGQKTYNGVATLSRNAGGDIVRDLPDLNDRQRRIVAGTFDGVRIVNVYVPNGEQVGSDKYAYKLLWLERLAAYLAVQRGQHRQVVVLGDFNIAPHECDVHDPQEWEGRVLFSEPERAAFRRVTEAGFLDTFRLFAQPAGEFSWWDYRMQAFRRNRGLRIDHILAADGLRDACVSCRIDRRPRQRERPSDHAPVVAELDLP